MSMLLMVRAMKQKVGNPLRKLVLIKLADNANDKGECWPSYQHIADICEISKRSVIGHVDALCDMNLIRKELRAGTKGNTSNLYIIFPDECMENPWGAANSLGGAAFAPGGAANSLGGAAFAPGGAANSLGGGAGDAPRISNSLESVKEPISPKGEVEHLQDKGKNKNSFDRKVIVQCWNAKADKHGLPRIRIITDTVGKRLKKFYDKYKKCQKELGKESREATDIICRFIEAYEPSPYALGQNPAGKKHGIDIAFVDWFVDQELAKE